MNRDTQEEATQEELRKSEEKRQVIRCLAKLESHFSPVGPPTFRSSHNFGDGDVLFLVALL